MSNKLPKRPPLLLLLVLLRMRLWPCCEKAPPLKRRDVLFAWVATGWAPERAADIDGGELWDSAGTAEGAANENDEAAISAQDEKAREEGEEDDDDGEEVKEGEDDDEDEDDEGVTVTRARGPRCGRICDGDCDDNCDRDDDNCDGDGGDGLTVAVRGQPCFGLALTPFTLEVAAAGMRADFGRRVASTTVIASSSSAASCNDGAIADAAAAAFLEEFAAFGGSVASLLFCCSRSCRCIS